jgi:hypothetical protein
LSFYPSIHVHILKSQIILNKVCCEALCPTFFPLPRDSWFLLSSGLHGYLHPGSYHHPLLSPLASPSPHPPIPSFSTVVTANWPHHYLACTLLLGWKCYRGDRHHDYILIFRRFFVFLEHVLGICSVYCVTHSVPPSPPVGIFIYSEIAGVTIPPA